MSSNNPYNLSTDYKALFELVNENNVIAAFIQYGTTANEICKVLRHIDSETYTISVRGLSYMDIYDWETKQRGISSEKIFIQACEQLNLRWIRPI